MDHRPQKHLLNKLMANKVDTPHPLYAPLQVKRDVFAAVKGGTNAMREAATKYLPKYPAEADKDYKSRLNSATIDGIVAGGVDTLCGAVFHGDVDTSKVNASIVAAKILENIDNEGTHFNIFARKAFDAAFDGSSVIIVDTPNAGNQPIVSLADEARLGIRPYWRLYQAKDVINWHYRVNAVSNSKELALLVLQEISDELIDRFERKPVTRYRVYEKDALGVVRWELWRLKDKKAPYEPSEFILEGKGILKSTSIPAAIIGDLTEEPRLLVESWLEVKAYQKESSFDQIEYLSVPTFYTKGYDGEENLALGASTHIRLPADPAAEAGYVQLDAAGHESLKATTAGIKDYIKARLNELTTQSAQMPVGGDEKTATQAVIEDRDKQARLILWAEQFKDALELALSFTAELMGMGRDEGGEIVLNTKWEMAKQAREQMMQAAKDAEGDDDEGKAAKPANA